MAANFSKRRDALKLDRESAINNIEPNPAHAVEKASLAATPVSSGDVIATLSANVSEEMPPTQSKKSDKLKAKIVVSSNLKIKRTHEVNEAEDPRNKSSQASCWATVAESEEIMASLFVLWILADYPESLLRACLIIHGQEKASNCRSLEKTFSRSLKKSKKLLRH